MLSNEPTPTPALGMKRMAIPPPPYAAPNTHNSHNPTFKTDWQTPRTSESNPGSRRKSRFTRFFCREPYLDDTMGQVEGKLLMWLWICLCTNFCASFILVCVAEPTIKLYQNPWNLSEMIGGATLTYAMVGSIVGAVAGSLSMCLSFMINLNYGVGLVLHLVFIVLFLASGTLMGYGTYITRNNHICNEQYTVQNGLECYSIQLSAGWRCGIVIVAMSAINVITILLYSVKWFVTWWTLKRQHTVGDSVV